MGQYRIRKAKPGEIPGYYSREQLGLRRFATGGQEEDNSANLSELLPQVTKTLATAILQDADPENVDIRPLMSKIAMQLKQQGVSPESIQPLVNAAGKKALQLVADQLDADKTEEETPEEQSTEEVEEPVEEETPTTNNYGYYDQSAATKGGEDDAVVDELLYSDNPGLQSQPEAAMGMQVDDGRNDFSAYANAAGIDDDYADYQAFENQMKYGGAQGKRMYMKEAMTALSKAAAGMQQQSGNSASLRGTSDDIQGKTLTSKDTFVPAVKQVAQNEVNKKLAEEQYKQMMSQNNMMNQDNSMMNQEFQFGGSNRRIRRANKAMFGTPHAIPGAKTNYDFGFLGGLRSASVEFDPRMMQSMFGVQSIMPGMIPGQSGSGGSSWYTPTYQIKGTRVKSSVDAPVAKVAQEINGKALDKVAEDTPNSGATVNTTDVKNVDLAGGTDGKTVGTANSELNEGTNGSGTSGGNNANGTNRGSNPNPVRTPAPIIPPVETPKTTPKKPKITHGNEVMIPGKDFTYYKTSDGKWHYQGKGGKHGFVTNEATLKQLKAGKFRLKNEYMSVGKLSHESDYNSDKRNSAYDKLPWYEKLVTSNPGFDEEHTGIRPVTGLNPANPDDFMANYVLPFMGPGAVKGAAQWALKPGAKALLGPGRSGLNAGQEMLNSGQGMLNRGQSMLNPPAGHQFSLGFDEGGSVNPDLYKYIYGGDDFNQDDLEDSYSKDTSDAYFRDGGLYHFDGEEDSEVESGTNASGMTREEIQKMLDAHAEKMKTQYGQQPQSYRNTNFSSDDNMDRPQYGGFGSSGVGQPMWGRPSYAPGYNMSGAMGQFGNMFSPYHKDFKYLSPYGGGKQGNMAINPMSLMAGSMANIQKSGMVPTKFSYSKEKKQDGNFFERKLGFNKDKVWTIDYNKPGSQPGAQPLGLPHTWDQSNKSADVTPNYGENKNPNRPTVAGPFNDPKGHWGPLAPGTDNGVSNGSGTDPEAMKFQASQQAQGKVWNENLKKWVDKNYVSPQGPQPISTGSKPMNEGQMGPFNNVGPVNTEMAYGGYLPLVFGYGGDVPDYAIAGEINNQVGTTSSIPSWVTNPIGTAMDDENKKLKAECTEEQKKDPKSPCYEKTSEQLKFTEEQAATFDPNALKNDLAVGARTFADTATELQGIKNNYVPGMQKEIYNRMTPQQRKYTGKWDENSGTQNIMGFEGVVKKGGTTGLRKNGEYQLTMDEIQEILKAGGKVEFI